MPRPCRRAESGLRLSAPGPGGLTAAYYLRRAGVSVTVYDEHEKAGGVLTYGIPHYRLPKTIVDSYVQALEKMGVRFVLNTTVGRDIALEEIHEQNDAVYMGTGAWRSPCWVLKAKI